MANHYVASQIKNNKNGKTAFGLVRDECPGCGSGDIGTSILKTILTLTAWS